MEKLKERHGVEVHLRALGVLWISLMGRDQTAALAAEVKAERERLKAARDAFEEAIMRRMASTAVIHYVDSQIDAEVQRLSRHVLTAADGDRKASLYAHLFSEAPGTAMRQTATPEQARYVRHLLTVLESGPAYAPFAAFVGSLTAAQMEVDVALSAREARYTEEAAAQTQLEMASEDARRLYNGFYARLSILFPERDALVESFFADL